MLNSDGKRELILAHHEARRQQKPVPAVVYFAGIAASCLVVVTGWWMTIGSNVFRPLLKNDEAVRIMTQGVQKLETNMAQAQQAKIPESQQIKAGVKEAILRLQQQTASSTPTNP